MTADFMSSLGQLRLSDYSSVGDDILEVVKKAVGVCSNISTVPNRTTHCAVLSDPVQYLTNFGESGVPSEQDICLAEQYLVNQMCHI